MRTRRQTAIGKPADARSTARASTAAVPARSAMWKGSPAWTRYVYSAKSANTNTATGAATVITVAVAPIWASWPMYKAATCKPAPVAAIEPKISMWP
jgi:hypothetical protein